MAWKIDVRGQVNPWALPALTKKFPRRNCSKDDPIQCAHATLAPMGNSSWRGGEQFGIIGYELRVRWESIRRLGKLLEVANSGTIPLISAWWYRLSSALNKIQISNTGLGANVDTQSPRLARPVHMFANVRPDWSCIVQSAVLYSYVSELMAWTWRGKN